MLKRMRLTVRWEFWPFEVFYLPVYFYWLWLSLRARSPVFFAASNPLMEWGGFMEYSKFRVLEQIPQAYRPVMQLFNPPFSGREQDTLQINFPLIAKPDKGERGRGVRRIESRPALQRYLEQATDSVIVQELVDLPLEFGVMYHRMPDKNEGRITSLMQREFLHVLGDGRRSVIELLRHSERNYRYATKIARYYPSYTKKILAKGERLLVEPIGNHSRGTIFRNQNHRITPELERTFDRLSTAIDGYFFGRYDLKAASWDDLYAGKVQVIELNGANSEPAHIYDPNMSLGTAYRDLFRHWRTLYRVSRGNHRLGVPYPTWGEVLNLLRMRWG